MAGHTSGHNSKWSQWQMVTLVSGHTSKWSGQTCDSLRVQLLHLEGSLELLRRDDAVLVGVTILPSKGHQWLASTHYTLPTASAWPRGHLKHALSQQC